ncbi:hypothetical protein [Bacteriovorax stolpii]|uniref:hypothetical protein n=1 Tax=Bacteriovorax stolpii TaxID=960 RepID=UPI00163CA084|nr:hypothetical protein [Bacteriovorax stolpii]
MKTILLTALLAGLSFTVSADENGAAACSETEAPAFHAASEGKNFPGSASLNECEDLSRSHIRQLYSKEGSRSKFQWEPYVKYACCKEKKSDPKCIEKKTEIAKRCESIAYLIGVYGRDWNDQEQIMASESSGGSADAAKAATQKNASASQISAAAASIKCKSAGIETLDYDACKKFQVTLDLLEGVTQVGYATQELVYKDKVTDSQLKYANEENAATGALKAQGESLSMQQDMYNQRMAVDSGKLAYLYSIYTDFPKTDDIVGKCSSIGSKGVDIGVTSKDCTEAARVQANGFKIVMNQSQRDAMKSKLIAIATSAGANGLLASLLGKRADDVNNAIAKIDAYKPIDPFTVSEDEAMTTFCKQNPGLAQCLTGGLERTFDTMNDNIITFGDGGTGTVYSNTNSGINSSGSTGTDGGTTSSSVTPVGSIIAAANKDNSIEASTAAKVTEGGSGSTGGGGGGGVGGGGGGGGSGPGTQAGSQGGVAAAVQGKTPSYGGGSGSISVMGGFGINKKKAEEKDGENPFGKLFGKDAPKGTGVVNFRDIASVGKKGDNLFDMISKRYTSVAADKRLIEYEMAK